MVHFFCVSEILIVAKRDKNITQVYHLYMFECDSRDRLKEFLNINGIDGKVHYPVPMHLQPAAKIYNYKSGDFPVSENACSRVISLPVHEFISKENLDYMISKIREFYK